MKIGVLFATTLVLATVANAKQNRPNIVWLVSEDNSADWLRLYNPEHGAAMPNIEALAKHGLVFNNAFSCGVVCSVARSTIISGCYAPRTATQYHRANTLVPMPDGLKMFPHYLRQAGYYTTNNKKEDYNFRDDEKEGVWDESSKKASYRNRTEGQPFFHVQNFDKSHEGKLHFDESWLKKKPTKTDPASADVFDYLPDTDIFR